jgi:hypothetical protein
MTDYYPLIARAVANLSPNNDAARRALYDRARNALVTQLRAQTPTLSDSEIARERRALDDAIRKVEMEGSGQPQSAKPPSSPIAGASIGDGEGPRSGLPAALATVWRRMGIRGIIIILVTAVACLLVFNSSFSTAVWGNNRESGLFVLVGLVAFGGAFVTVFWAIAFPICAMIEWNRLRASQVNSRDQKGSVRSPVGTVQPVVADSRASAYDQNAAKAALQDRQLPAQHKTNDPPTFIGYLPGAVGALGAVIGMIVSISIAKGAEVITLTGKLAGVGCMIGYPIGALSRAAIIHLWRSRGTAT